MVNREARKSKEMVSMGKVRGLSLRCTPVLPVHHESPDSTTCGEAYGKQLAVMLQAVDVN